MATARSPAGRRRLGELLVEAGLLDEERLETALKEQRKWGGRLGRTLVEMGFVAEPDLVHVLAQQLQLRTVDLDRAELPPRITECLRLDLAERYGVFPLGVDAQGTTLFVATSDPTNIEQQQELEFATSMKVELAVATGSSIDRAIRKFYFGDDSPPPGASPPTRAPRQQVDETTYELTELLGEAQPATAPASVKSAPPPPVPPRLPEPGTRNLKQEVALLREQVQGLEAITTSQVKALRVLLELLIESGLLTRDEYLERLHRDD